MNSTVIHTLRIKDVEIPNNLVLGPMAGVCDLPFRLLCHEQGAGMTCMEMISAKAIYYRNKATDEMMKIDPAIASTELFNEQAQMLADIGGLLLPLKSVDQCVLINSDIGNVPTGGVGISWNFSMEQFYYNHPEEH